MGNYKWNTNNSNRDLPYVVILMISRNKDNKDISNFKMRKYAKFRTKDMDKINKDFINFACEGVPGETSRLYISLNARDTKKVHKQLLHKLIDENICFDYIEPIIAGIAAEKQNAAEKKWFFDFDLKNDSVYEFVEDIISIDKTTNPTVVETPNGYAVIVEHGFDTRLIFEKWDKNIVSLKRDDLICINWIRKG